MSAIRYLVVDLRISREEYLKLYAGVATQVHAWARDGRRIQFPADSLRAFVTANGVAGSFELKIDSSNKLLGIKQLG